MSIKWRGGVGRSVIKLGWHYQTVTGCAGGPDREALGTLTGFSVWRTSTDSEIDVALSSQHPSSSHLPGSHGDRRQVTYGGHLWRTYEAQESWATALGSVSPWHMLLYDVSARRLTALTLTIGGVKRRTSFNNPTAQVLPAPTGRGRVLVVTVFVGYQGELIFYNPI
jgi:hypothetical protein